MKKYIIIAGVSLILLTFSFTACGNMEHAEFPTSKEFSLEADLEPATTENDLSYDTFDSNESDEISESLSRLEIPVNTQAEDVPYLSEDGIDPMRAIHRCVSDGKNIFLAYNEPDIFVMPIGADKHSPANIENPDGMSVCNVAIDTYGKIHLLMAGQNYEEWYIWCLDEDYQVERGIDISAYFETKQMPMWFLIDKDGTFYLQWSLNRNGIILDREGVMLHKTTPETLGLGWIYEAAVGKDGQIYLAYKDDDKLEIGALDVENCSIKKEASSLSFANNETFSAMSAGTDTNLLLYSPNSGVWAYDNENGVHENRVALSDICFGNDMEYWPLTFVPDGRLLLLGKTINSNVTKPVELLMKYIPAGR